MEPHKLRRIKTRAEYNRWRRSPEFSQWRDEQYYLQDGRCYYCFHRIKIKEGSFHVDHKKPIYKEGTNDPSNLCLACPPCNLYKNIHGMRPDVRARRFGIRERMRDEKLLIAHQEHAYLDAMMFAAIERDN